MVFQANPRGIVAQVTGRQRYGPRSKGRTAQKIPQENGDSGHKQPGRPNKGQGGVAARLQTCKRTNGAGRDRTRRAPAGPDLKAAKPDFEAAGPGLEPARPDFEAVGPGSKYPPFLEQGGSGTGDAYMDLWYLRVPWVVLNRGGVAWRSPSRE